MNAGTVKNLWTSIELRKNELLFFDNCAMSITTSYISARLPVCLGTIVIDYFGRNIDPYNMAECGQWEDCANILPDHKLSIFTGACYGGYIAIVNMAIANMAVFKDIDHWHIGMSIASYYGHLTIAELMIAHGANNWNYCMVEACILGHFDIINLMIAHGANSWNDCLTVACENDQYDVAEFMISKGAILCYCGKTASEHMCQQN